MTAKAEFVISGDTRDAVRALDKLHKQQIRLRDENEKLKAANKSQAAEARKGLREQREEAKRSAEAYNTVRMAVVGVGAAFTKAALAVAQFRKELGDKQIAADTSVRELAKQAQINVPDARRMLERSVIQGSKFAIPSQTSEAAIRELISQGVQNPEVALGGLLPALQAANAGGDDPRSTVKGIAGLLAAAGEQKTPENVRKVAQTAALAFAGKPLQFADLASLSPNAAKAKTAGVNLDEQIAAFVTLQESGLPTDLAGSGVGQAALKLAAIGDKKPQVEALAALGLTPRDVNPLAQGGLAPAIGRLSKGLNTLPEDQRAALLSRIVGEEGITPVATLVQNQGLLAKNMSLGADDDLFKQQVAVGSQGLAAASVRLANEQRVTDIRSGLKEGLQNLIMEQVRQDTARKGAVGQFMASQMENFPNVARLIAAGGDGSETGVGEARKRVEELTGSDTETKQLLGQIRDAVKDQRTLNLPQRVKVEQELSQGSLLFP